jgi:2-polyprenyl-6-methoxyphenol hydroxylase-like FAD-dependent oxidoreductase
VPVFEFWSSVPGIAGLAAARTLRDWGAAVELVERQLDPPREGTGIYLLGNAVRALDTLGVGDQVAERAIHIRRQWTADGRALFEVDVDQLWDGVGPCLALPRTDLHRVLLAGIEGVPVRWGQSPQAITIDGHRVVVTISGARTDYDLVLGADGVHSTVRRLVLGPGGGASRVTGRSTATATDPSTDLLAGYADPVPTLLDALDTVGGVSVVHAGPVEEVLLDAWSYGAALLIG